MKIGDAVKIVKCNTMPEVVGESAEMVDMQIQEFEKYTVYPLWGKMTSGERKGKIYGFKCDEVEVLPKAQPKVLLKQHASRKTVRREETMKTKVDAQVREILSGATTLEDLVEIESLINELKGKILEEPGLGFWEGKTPCWDMFRCPEEMRNECPAFKYRTLPCWQIEGTYCKLMDYGAVGDGTEICENCRVYKRWGHGERIQIKLRGKGFDSGKP